MREHPGQGQLRRRAVFALRQRPDPSKQNVLGAAPDTG